MAFDNNILNLVNYPISEALFKSAYLRLVKQYEIDFENILIKFSHSEILKIYIILDMNIFTQYADLSLLSSAYFYHQINKLLDFDKKMLEKVEKIINGYLRLLKTLIYEEVINNNLNKYQNVYVDELYAEMLFYFPKALQTIYYNDLNANTTDELLEYSSFSFNTKTIKTRKKISKIDFLDKRKFYKPYRYPFVASKNDHIYDGIGPVDIEKIILMKQAMITSEECLDIIADVTSFTKAPIIIKMPNLTDLSLGLSRVDLIATQSYNNYQESRIYKIISQAVNSIGLTNVIYILPTLDHHDSKDLEFEMAHNSKGMFVDKNIYTIEQSELKNVSHSIIDLESLTLEESGFYFNNSQTGVINSLKDIRSKFRIGNINHLVYNIKELNEEKFSKLLNMGFRALEIHEEDYAQMQTIMKDFKERRPTEFLKTIQKSKLKKRRKSYSKRIFNN